MSLKLFTCHGGEIILPDKDMVLVSREDGGNLVVNPPREVWERSELNPVELTLWSFLVAAAGKAMLDVLPQLEGGCINYWEAGNWALNEQADPKGLKTAKEYRKVHLHLLGRNPASTNPSMQWGEAPKFPSFAGRRKWAEKHKRLTAEECGRIIERVENILNDKYKLSEARIAPYFVCCGCGYPVSAERHRPQNVCAECQ